MIVWLVQKCFVADDELTLVGIYLTELEAQQAALAHAQADPQVPLKCDWEITSWDTDTQREGPLVYYKRYPLRELPLHYSYNLPYYRSQPLDSTEQGLWFLDTQDLP